MKVSINETEMDRNVEIFFLSFFMKNEREKLDNYGNPIVCALARFDVYRFVLITVLLTETRRMHRRDINAV